MNKKEFLFKNGGFPPIKYCPELDTDKIVLNKLSKERFFSNAPKQNINIRQLLSESAVKKPLVVIDNNTSDNLEEVTSL